MDLKKIAMGVFANKVMGDNAGALGDVMDNLIGSGDQMDVASLIGNMKANGLGDVASSWLGDGANAEISNSQLKDVLGQDDIAQAAAKLGTDEGSLLDGLRGALPQIVDKASSGGSLMGSLGGMAKKFM